MKTLVVQFIKNEGDSEELKSLPVHKIDQVSWSEYPYPTRG